MSYTMKDFKEQSKKILGDFEPLTEVGRREVERLTNGLTVNFVRAKPADKEKPRKKRKEDGQR